MTIDYDKKEISMENCLILKNNDIGIEIKGNGLGIMSINFSNINMILRVNKSKVITKIKWIIAVIKYKI